MTISIVTCWAGNTAADLLPDYAAAVGGDTEVITVDNASAPETAQALATCGGVYLRQERNEGFAGGNNIGYAKATGDIIIFLNSDVAPTGDWLRMVAADVKDGALYGPALAQQLVAGRWLPYLEGWCVAATRATWERLIPLRLPIIHGPMETDELERVRQEIHDFYGSGSRIPVMLSTAQVEWVGGSDPPGPWDALAYPGPYWEDNDLCLRALQAGLNLIQTAWPIAHKGGRTAGPILRHGASFAQNEATFTARVLAAFSEPPAWSDIYQRYMQHVHTQSDIQHHLPLLYSFARGTIVELGTRTGVSTAAFLAGVEQRGGHVISFDIDPSCGALYADHPQWTFVNKSSTDAEFLAFVEQAGGTTGPLDVLFIDTEHTYEQAAAELALWHSHVAPGGTILMHDPETFPGVRRAAQEFADAHGWPITFVLPCNGMAVIRRPEE